MFASLTAQTTAPVLLTAAIAVLEMSVKLDLAAVLLHARFDEYHFSLCDWLRPDLLRQRPCQPERFLDASLIFGAIYLAMLLVISVPYLRFYLG